MPTLYDNFSQVKQYIDQEIPDLTSYVTKTELAACSYVTSSDLPVIDESIIPKETDTYTLGDSSHYYSTAYISNIYNLIWTGTSTEYAALSDYTTYQIYLIQEA